MSFSTKSLFVIFALACSSLCLRAQWTTQTIQLRPGFNAVFLEVEPEDNRCEAVMAGLPVESVWRWNRRFNSVQFISDPNQLINEPEAWLMWFSGAQPIGGAFKVLGTAELYIPIPGLKDVNTARVSWFVDVGNAYKDYKNFSASTLRASTGVSLHWQAPIGPLIINFATPIRSKPEDRHYEERIQFTFGSQF